MPDHEWNHVSDRNLGPCDLPNVHRALIGIQYNWECMATQFGLPQATVKTAKLKHHHDPKRCLKYVLGQWLKGKYDTQRFGHPSWRRVCEVAAEPAGGDNQKLACEIAANVRFYDPPEDTAKPAKIIIVLFVFLALLIYLLVILSQAINNSSLPKPLVLYQGYLRKIYRQHAYPIHKKPSEVIAFNRPKQPLNLVIVPRRRKETDRSFLEEHEYARKGNVDEIQSQKSKIEIEEIGLISGEKPVAHFVFIEGAPGIGKSTLCWQLCRLWAEGKLQLKWDLMVLVEIRHETMRKARSVYDLLYHHNDKTRELIVNEVKEQEGEGLLIIFDGYDELSEDQRSELSVFQLILTNRLLSKATVVVTSRPMATASLPSQFIEELDQHIAIVGFDKDTIHAYIRLACGDNRNLSEHFHTYVSSRPFIFSVMYNPLHCTIVTELYIQYWQDGQKGFAPNTLTELYTSLVLNLIRRNSACNAWHMGDLPAHVNNSLMQLAELAASGLKEEKYVFSNVPHDTLGLMVPVRQVYDIRAGQPTYMFLHLTLQEYLSALYWSQQTQQQYFLKEESILRHIDKCARAGFKNNDYCRSIHWPHILFLAGLTKFNHPFLLELIPKKEHLYSEYVGSLCQLSFEAQSPQIVSTMFSSRYVGIRDHLDALDLFVIGYCIANSDNTTMWNIVDHCNPENRHPRSVLATSTMCACLSVISDGLYYSLNTTAWSARPSQPSVHLMVTVNWFQNISRIHLLTSVTTEFYASLDRTLNSGEGFSLLQSFSYFFPRLVSLHLPGLSFILTDSPKLPQSLVSIRHLTLPHYNVLLDNLHEYPALEDLDITTMSYMYQRWPIKSCPQRKTYENYYQSLQVENDNDCLSLERNLPKLAHKLKTFRLLDVRIDHLCVRGIAHLLNTSLNNLKLFSCLISSTDFDSLTTAIATSNLKHLEIKFTNLIWSCDFGINLVRGQSLAKLLTQSKTLEEVTVAMEREYTNNCNVARLLVEAMTHSSVKKLILYTPYYCDVSDIHYDRERVEVSSLYN